MKTSQAGFASVLLLVATIACASFGCDNNAGDGGNTAPEPSPATPNVPPKPTPQASAAPATWIVLHAAAHARTAVEL